MVASATNFTLPVSQTVYRLGRSLSSEDEPSSGYEKLADDLKQPILDQVILTSTPPKDIKKRLYNPNEIEWETYEPPTHLSGLQKFCLNRIKGYQQATREDASLKGKFLRTLIMGSNGTCAFKQHHHLSCSEYTYAAIAELGVVRGVLAGVNRIFWRCTPWNYYGKHDYTDPVFRVKIKQGDVSRQSHNQGSVFTLARLSPLLDTGENGAVPMNAAA